MRLCPSLVRSAPTPVSGRTEFEHTPLASDSHLVWGKPSHLVSEMLSVVFVENEEKHTGSALPHSPAILMLVFWSSESVLGIRVPREWLTLSRALCVDDLLCHWALFPSLHPHGYVVGLMSRS